MARMGR
jgi:hypothetical protein